MRAVTAIWVSALLTAGLSAVPHGCRAQGGPPMVTDDPDTPGDGHWENNIATIATRTGGRWDLNAPDADLNYGWGDNVQLNADIPWTLVHKDGGGWDAGPGSVQLGIKWRFLDLQQLGYTMSTYPKFTSAWVESSRRRGVADAGHEFFLPLEAATKIAGFRLDAEIGRAFDVGSANQWQLGAIGAHSCGASIECMLELRETLSGSERQTLVNLGAHWQLGASLALLAAVGREFGTASAEQQRALVYLGIQMTR
jgi:hypothetical protein